MITSRKYNKILIKGSISFKGYLGQWSVECDDVAKTWNLMAANHCKNVLV